MARVIGNSTLPHLREQVQAVAASTATTSINLSTGGNPSIFKVTLSASTTITFTNPPVLTSSADSFSWTMMVVNDATAGRTIAFANTIKWAGGTLPPRTTTANAIDIWTFVYENSVYYGSLSIIDAK